MTIYTGIADSNGDFNIPFSTSYTSGQKVIITSEKDSAVKTIELFAPSETTGAMMQFSGTTVNFPLNIGDVTIKMSGKLQDYAFSCATTYNKPAGFQIAKAANSISLLDCTEIGSYAFEYSNILIQDMLFSPSLKTIGGYAFQFLQRSQSVTVPKDKTFGSYIFSDAKITSVIFEDGIITIPTGFCYQCAGLINVIIPQTVTSIGGLAFNYCSGLKTLIVHAILPPTLNSSALTGIGGGCIIKVPASSVAAYKAATNWSTYKARIQAI